MILKPNQIQEILDVIDSFHTLFIAETTGPKLLSKKDKALLKSFGFNTDDFTAKENYVEHSYKFGMLAASLRQNKKKISEFSYDQFKKFISSGNFLPLSEVDKYSLNHIMHRLYSDIKGLGNRIGRDVTNNILKASQQRRAKYEKILKKEFIEGIIDRKSITQISSSLGEKTKDWARDFDRIADYVMHESYQYGIANSLLNQYGEEVMVWYDVRYDACEHCVRTYLTSGRGSEPKQFKLLEVIANGDNIGRKAKEYKPSVSPLHPWCRCTMGHVPENSEWNAVKRQYDIVRQTYGVNRKSKIKIIVEP